ncbi:MAG: hypothetical protein K8F25_07790 [Fimbriimonadaceae bacterium]|nr:hypothetical protein [Alphaproteobacteria bacterium]
MTQDSTSLPVRLRDRLRKSATGATAITYQMLARDLRLGPPNTIRQVTGALEQLMREDAARDHPFIAALAIGKSHNGLPAPGFFQMAALLGRYKGDMTRADMTEFHASELLAAIDFWRSPGPCDPA